MMFKRYTYTSHTAVDIHRFITAVIYIFRNAHSAVLTLADFNAFVKKNVKFKNAATIMMVGEAKK